MSNPQATRKTDLQDLSRVIFSHRWRDASEWGRAVHDLADLSDEEIDRIATLKDGAGAPHDA